jgi:hypothetical protein
MRRHDSHSTRPCHPASLHPGINRFSVLLRIDEITAGLWAGRSDSRREEARTTISYFELWDEYLASSAKYSHCSGTKKLCAAVSALIVSSPSLFSAKARRHSSRIPRMI